MVTLGNHEFDAGEVALERMLAKEPEVPFVATNLKGTLPENLARIPPYRIQEVNSPNGVLRVAILGILGVDAARSSQVQRREAHFVGWDDEKARADEKALRELLRAQVAEVRTKSDVVILLAHAGQPEDEELAREVPGIDLILAGHTHQLYEQVKKVNDTWIAQAGQYGQNLGVLDLLWDGQKLFVRNPDSPYAAVNAHLFPDEEWLKRLTAFKALIDPLLQPFGVSFSKQITILKKDLIRQRQLQDPAGVHIVSLMRKALDRHLPKPADVYFTSAALLRDDLRTVNGQPTPILFSDVFRVFGIGFDEELRPGSPVVDFYLKKKEFARVLHFMEFYRRISGNFTPLYSDTLTYDSRRWGIPLWNQAHNLQLHGRPESEWPEMIHIATSAYAAPYLQKFPQMSRGFIEVQPRDAEGQPINEFKSVPGLNEASLLAEGLQNETPSASPMAPQSKLPDSSPSTPKTDSVNENGPVAKPVESKPVSK